MTILLKKIIPTHNFYKRLTKKKKNYDHNSNSSHYLTF